MHLLLVWFREKNDLIHPVEFAAKFCAKLLSLKPFSEYNTALACILMNYILEQKGFRFVNIPTKRKITFKKAVLAASQEDFKPITKLVIEESS
jgi:hypothetical protein